MKAERRAQWAGLVAGFLLLAFDASAQGQQQPPPPDKGDDARPQWMGQGPHRQQRGRGTGPQQGAVPTAGPAQFAADDAAAPRGGRMSREERRQLRRDVHEAGRDLYPERRRGGGQQASPGPTPGESAPAR